MDEVDAANASITVERIFFKQKNTVRVNSESLPTVFDAIKLVEEITH